MYLKTITSTLIVILLCGTGKCQSKDASHLIRFICIEKMIVILDSLGNFQLSEGWQKDSSDVFVFGNKVKVYNLNRTFEEYTLGVKTNAYKVYESTLATWVSCRNQKGDMCNVRLMLQPNNSNLLTSPSFLYIDYKELVYVYKILLAERSN